MRAVARHASRLGVADKVRELPVPSDSGAADDGLLVSRALGGDRWAEEALYRAHVRAIARIVTRLLARSHEAEDVVQEAFFLAFTSLKDLRHADSFRAWLIQIAVRLVRLVEAHMRAKNRTLAQQVLERYEREFPIARRHEEAQRLLEAP
jgi:RNA polymerase sigma factor (sigma-70 family)